ncbi:MAG: aminopeptidase P family protein [Chloroflexi bacterium]|nr:aminopeptidase P family protein [Chloroflexota bacterium]
MQYRIRIQPQGFHGRCQTLLAHIQKANLSGVVLFDATNILYFTGFAFIPTERPIAFVMNADGRTAMFVPRLEVEHVKTATDVDRVSHYREYPGDPHPMNIFKTLLDEMGLIPKQTRPSGSPQEDELKQVWQKTSALTDCLEDERQRPLLKISNARIGADQDGYPPIFGYQGPTLTELTGMTVVNIQGQVNQMQAIKSEAELALIRESCKWAHLAHMLLQRYTAVGATETAVSLQASNEATLTMMDSIGPLYRAQSLWSNGPNAGYRGQIGRNAAIPHALANNITFQPGDVLVTGAGCPMWGYNSELERTMFMGEPNARQIEMFSHMKNAQEIALEMMQPGVKCSDVDTAVRAYYQKHNLMPTWKHHTGHAIGLRYHEGPFLDTGDDTIMQPGMVFTIEPGFYTPDLGGFRHSDTVAITANGSKIMTYYPREWQDLVIPV